ncbi:hypothetical protein GCM10011348_23430 [Marinobacterium nitratireducens]|uniref:Zinc finger/thioredoxin putative domain-containing protein n=1 Tax=Marinobacterium nitratireducens TaxID=518897 RepID=A0A918DSL4_9GAMM|nr:DUF3426 domain-containing protein [Marinobacterium nitratireducens]GGO82317.1 hypothetical protein GCM10011348_23430 [Marinobacterium nitratireducens]
MQDGLITECPECQTRFNVSDGQLRLAGGKVRCGACLTVFDARAHQPLPQGSDEVTSHAPASDAATVADFRFDTETPVEIGDKAPGGPTPTIMEQAAQASPVVQQWTPPQQDSPPLRPAPPQADRPPPPQPAPLPPRLSVDDLHAEPLQLQREPEPASPTAILGWSLGCLFALALLASQLVWFNRLEWSQQERLAGFYEILCNQVRCNIPPRRDIDSIRNLQLVVRAHPQYQEALSVHLLLENDAGFDQPFPAIDLTFADIRGRTVAERRLQPGDYLDPALNPLRMRHREPYQINLEVLDPGRRAVSYEVELAPATLASN